MPRKIPWLTASSAKAKVAATSSERQKPSSRPAKRQRLVTPEFDEDVENEFIASGASARERKERAGKKVAETDERVALTLTERAMSSSPIHSSPEEEPPAKEYMKEGIGADDDWMMVEDEFLSTATLFTRHLHHAEYVRLRKLQAEARLPSRPTAKNEKVPVETKNRSESPARSHFRGLAKGPPPSAALPAIKKQERPKPRPEPLPVPAPRRRESTTPSAINTNRSILASLAKELDGLSASEDSDDLDAPARPRPQPSKPVPSRVQQHFGVAATRKPLLLSPPKRPPDPPVSSSRKPLTSSTTSKTAASSRLSSSEFLDGLDPLHSQKSSDPSNDTMSRIAKRGVERAKKQEEEKKRKSLLLEEIPTFLV